MERKTRFIYNHNWHVQDGVIQVRKDIIRDLPVRQVIIWRRKGGINFNPGYFLPTYEVIYMIPKPEFKLVPKANAVGDVWEFTQEMNNDHPAPFPVALIDRIISSTSAQIILDPFSGSGTTAIVALGLKLNNIGIELSPDYCAKSEKRIERNKKQSELLKFKTATLFQDIEMKIYTKDSLITELKKIASKGWIPNARNRNHRGIGNTLEDLLSISENNLPIPNAAEWELKSQRLNTSSLTTLFHIEPSPRAVKFVPQVGLLKYGWKHQQASKKYPDNEMSFRLTIHGLTPSERGFMVKINREDKKVLISFDETKVAHKHSAWLKSVPA